MIVGMHVYAYGVLVACGIVVDMSESGLRLSVVEDFSDDQLDPGKHLDIVMEDAPAEQWMPVQVVRKWDDGFAASFIGAQTEAGLM
jgi:hypothetical protein